MSKESIENLTLTVHTEGKRNSNLDMFEWIDGRTGILIIGSRRELSLLLSEKTWLMKEDLTVKNQILYSLGRCS